MITSTESGILEESCFDTSNSTPAGGIITGGNRSVQPDSLRCALSWPLARGRFPHDFDAENSNMVAKESEIVAGKA